ncbi:hypothetical protein Btru_060787 [Bulinus truncatus]|nr:hypothetical protein Btru_060787 [Bulinus truncatus]
MSKPGTIDCSHVFLLPACGVSYLRRRYLRRSLSLLAALFTVVFIFKVQHLISDMSDAHGIRSKLNFHWTLTEVVSSGPAPSEDREEDEKARIRFAELGVNLINPIQVEDGGADTEPYGRRGGWSPGTSGCASGSSWAEETWNEIVDREQKIHGDVVVVDEEDTYEYLPNKVFDGITWVLRQARRPRYVMKTDDDTFIGLFQLLREPRRAPSTPPRSSAPSAATPRSCGAPETSGRSATWTTLSRFTDVRLRRWLRHVSLSAASLLVDTRARTFDWIHLEDVYITGMLAKKAGLTHVNHPGFSYWSSPKATPCDFVKNNELRV